MKLFIQFLFLTTLIFAQSNKSIEGYIYDSNGKVLPGVNVVVNSKENNKIVSGTTSDTKGYFNIKNIKPEKITISFSFIGFEHKIIDTLLTGKENNFGNITLNNSSQTTSEVTIKSFKPMIEYFIDKKVVNIDQVPAATGSVSDALGTTGLVDVDPVTKKISIRGEGIRILIDGKPAPMGDEMVTQLPAEAVEKVEVITNPSAKDDPEGGNYTVNLITKKGLLDSFSGSISLNGSTNNSGQSSIRLNYKSGKFNIYGGFQGSLWDNSSIAENKRKNYESVSNYYSESNGENNYNSVNQSYKVTVDYDPDEMNNISVTGNVSKQNSDGDNSSNDYMYSNSNVMNYYSNVYSNRVNDNIEYRLSGYYKRKFDKKGHEFVLDALYFTYDRYNENNYNGNFSYKSSTPELKKTENDITNNTFILKAEYDNPTDFGRFEGGYHFTFRDRKNDLKALNYSYNFNLWIDSLNQSNFFGYQENVHALYFSYGHNIGNFGVKTGLRFEQVYDEGELITTSETFKNNYTSFYPSLNLMYKFTDWLNVNFSAGRKVSRPMMEWINPFVTENSHNFISKGNPNIKPTYTNLFELQIANFLNLYYNVQKGSPRGVETLTNDSIVTSTWINLASNTSKGFDVTLPYYKSPSSNDGFFSWLENAYFRFAYSIRKSEGSYQREILNSTTKGWNIQGNVSVGLWWDLKLSAFMMYQPKEKNERGITSSYNNLSMSLRKSLFEGKLRLGLTFMNVLNTKGFKRESFGSNYYTYNNWGMKQPQFISFSIQYLFNNFKDKSERDIDDGRDRGGDNSGRM